MIVKKNVTDDDDNVFVDEDKMRALTNLVASHVKIYPFFGARCITGVHFSFDVLPLGADQGSCALKYVC